MKCGRAQTAVCRQSKSSGRAQARDTVSFWERMGSLIKKNRDRLSTRGSERLLLDLSDAHRFVDPRRITRPPLDPFRLLEEDPGEKMQPGDIMLLPDSDAFNSEESTPFFAVLACPVCGTSGLITVSQYFGAAPVCCAKTACSQKFRIVYERRFAYLDTDPPLRAKFALRNRSTMRGKKRLGG